MIQCTLTYIFVALRQRATCLSGSQLAHHARTFSHPGVRYVLDAGLCMKGTPKRYCIELTYEHSTYLRLIGTQSQI